MGTSWNSPYVAILIATIAWAIAATAGVFAGIGLYLTFAIVGELLPFVVLGITAIVIPYRRKEFFNSSPALFRKKIANIPIISVLGLFNVIAFSYLIYATFLPAVTPPPSGPPLVQLGIYAFVPVLIIIGLLLYAVAYSYRKSKGIDLSYVYREIPPE